LIALCPKYMDVLAGNIDLGDVRIRTLYCEAWMGPAKNQHVLASFAAIIFCEFKIQIKYFMGLRLNSI